MTLEAHHAAATALLRLGQVISTPQAPSSAAVTNSARCQAMLGDGAVSAPWSGNSTASSTTADPTSFRLNLQSSVHPASPSPSAPLSTTNREAPLPAQAPFRGPKSSPRLPPIPKVSIYTMILHEPQPTDEDIKDMDIEELEEMARKRHELVIGERMDQIHADALDRWKREGHLRM
ncbi:UNVERIFIED_CONTAM: hypothetical protein HDU68_010761 [Siphonaria sp. JEL0065]|nr:hypothetical protein HDU68_010761 [Siphonaria sp. JEL0065]